MKSNTVPKNETCGKMRILPMMSGRTFLTRSVWILSFVSLLNDIASEMLYPVMPVFLKSIGFSILLIGVLEGFAEATAGLSKGYFGELSDKKGIRVPFIRAGYALSALSKPLLVLLTNVYWVFTMRTADKVGKGLRTAARDAMLSDEATPETKGRVFGFHRAMDTTGAFIGPAAALLFLYFFPEQYKSLFLIAFLPGIAAVSLTFFLKDKKRAAPAQKQRVSFVSFLQYWKRSPAEYKKLISGLLVFALFNSSDVFLLLKVKEAGLDDTYVIGAYIFYNLVYALFAYPLGDLADRIGLKKVFIGGLLLFAAVYGGMALSNSLYAFLGLFFLYGIYSAATEGIAKAWITNIVSKEETATAIGTFTAFQSISAMLASSFAGLIWYQAGATATFGLSAIVVFGVALYFMTAFPKEKNPESI